MKNLIIHVPHTSMYIPEEYSRTALIPRHELEEETRFMCDTGILQLIPAAFAKNAIVFPYSRLYCDVERFRDGTEPMEKLGMGYIYTHDSRGREMFRPTEEHRVAVSKIYDEHHKMLNKEASRILEECGSCLIIDLHSFGDEQVQRMFGLTDLPDVCIGTEPGHYDPDLTEHILDLCRSLGLKTAINFPYKGSLVPTKFFGRKDTGIVSIMLEINKRILA